MNYFSYFSSLCVVNWEFLLTQQKRLLFVALHGFSGFLSIVSFSHLIWWSDGIWQQILHNHQGAQLWATWALSGGAAAAIWRPQVPLILNLTCSCLTDASPPWVWQASPLRRLSSASSPRPDQDCSTQYRLMDGNIVCTACRGCTFQNVQYKFYIQPRKKRYARSAARVWEMVSLWGSSGISGILQLVKRQNALRRWAKLI